MSKLDARSRPRPTADQLAEEASVARLDSAHPVRKQPDALPADLPAAERIRVQADQLASHLQVRQQTIDHREARLNGQIAQLQRDARTARLWLRERVAELDDREKQLTGQQVETSHEARQQQASAVSKELALRAKELHRATESLQARQRQLDKAEARLAEAYTEMQQLREQLTDAQRRLDADGRRQRQQIAAQQRRAMDDLAKQREAVQRRSDHVDQCRAALVNLRGELSQMHGETLENRLAVEELSAQLAGAASPAALTGSLAKIRTKLAEHYRLAKAELDEQEAELESLRRQIVGQFDKLLTRKREHERRVDTRRRELDEQAAQLTTREEQLRRREAELEAHTYRGQAERLAHQHEIRRRTRQHGPEEATASA